MTSIQSRMAWTFLLGTLGILLVWNATQAQPEKSVAPESLLPGDAVAYFRWDGQAAHRDAWEQTAAYDALEKTGTLEVIDNIVRGIADEVLTGPQSVAAEEIAETFMAHGLSMAVSLAPGEMPLPHAVFVFHQAGEVEPQLSRMIRRMLEREMEFETVERQDHTITKSMIPDSPGVELGWWTAGGHLVVAVGIDAVNQALRVETGNGASITSHPLWGSTQSKGDGFVVTTAGWFDFGALRTKFGGLAIPSPGPRGSRPLTVNTLLEKLGFDNVGAIQFRSGYKGRSLWSESTVGIDGEKHGLMALADQQTISLADLPPVPVNTSGFYASSFDWSQAYDSVLGVVRDFTELGPPDMSEQIEAMIASVPSMIGFDPKADFLDTLGNVNCVYSDPDQGAFGFGFGVAIEVKDANRLRQTVNKLLRLVAANMRPSEVLVDARVKRGREVLTFGIGGGFFSPAMTVDDNWLVIGMSPQTIDAFLMRLDGELDRWTPTGDFAPAFAELPENFTSVSVLDPRQTYRSMLGMAPTFLGFAQGAAMQSQMGMSLPISVADIPPAESFTKPLFPNVTMSYADGQNLHLVSRESLPAFPTLGVSNGAAVPILVALLLPAVQQAREAARQAQSKNNMKQLGLAMHIYHDSFNKFPAGTVVNEQLEADDRLSFFVSLLPYMDQQQLAEAIDRESGWNSDRNQQVTSTAIPTLIHPSIGTVADGATTHYVGISGWGPDSANLPIRDPKAGIFGYNRETRIRDITDGTSNTMMMSEASSGFGNWAQGGKATIRVFSQLPYVDGPDGIGGPSPTGFNVLFADGSVRLISNDVDTEILRRLAAMHDGQVVGGGF